MSECWVYKAFHCLKPTDRLLYVGISDTPSDRMTQHSRDKWWWHLVNRIEWFKLESRDHAALKESQLIAEKQPLFNKHQSTLTAGAVLFGCLELIAYSFEHCPLCHSSSRYSRVEWKTKSLCEADVGEEVDAECFEVWMRCDSFHAPVEWTQLIPIGVLCQCKTGMPQEVVASLWETAVSNGEVGEDIPELRPATLAEMFCFTGADEATHSAALIEAN